MGIIFSSHYSVQFVFASQNYLQSGPEVELGIWYGLANPKVEVCQHWPPPKFRVSQDNCTVYQGSNLQSATDDLANPLTPGLKMIYLYIKKVSIF